MDDNTDPCPTLCPFNKVPSFKICGTTEKCLQTKPARHLPSYKNPWCAFITLYSTSDSAWVVWKRNTAFCCVTFCSCLFPDCGFTCAPDSRRQHGFHRRTGRKDRSEIITAFAFFFFFPSCVVVCCAFQSTCWTVVTTPCCVPSLPLLMFYAVLLQKLQTELVCTLNWSIFFFSWERSSIHPSSTPTFTRTHGRRGRMEFQIKKNKNKNKRKRKAPTTFGTDIFRTLYAPTAQGLFFFLLFFLSC